MIDAKSIENHHRVGLSYVFMDNPPFSQEFYIEHIKNAPTHPGIILYRTFIRPLGLDIREVSKGLRTSQSNLSRILDGTRGISIDMAYKLSIAFDCEPMYWLELQLKYDVYKKKLKYCGMELKKFHKSD